MNASMLVVLLVTLALVGSSPWAGGPPGRPVDVVPAPPRTEPAVIPLPVLLELVAGALDSGVGVPGALEAVGVATGGTVGEGLRKVAAGLVLGGSWEQAWAGTGQMAGHDHRCLEELAAALGPTWSSGQAPGPALRAAAAQHRVREHRVAQEAAGRLGARLVLPLGLCLLPSFLLLGLVPVLLALVRGLVPG